jgi:thiamine-monophosphate kinase
LLFAAAPADRALVEARAAAAGVAVTRIGRFVAGVAEVAVGDADGRPVALAHGGWSHF